MLTLLTFACLKSTNNTDTRKRCEICSKLKIYTLELRDCGCSGVFLVNFEHILHLFLSVSIVDFEQVNVSWESGVSTIATCIYSTWVEIYPRLNSLHKQ